MKETEINNANGAKPNAFLYPLLSIEMEQKCYYPDWEGGIIASNKHIYGKDGYCIVCGYRRSTN